jgi:hypothetical protein
MEMKMPNPSKTKTTLAYTQSNYHTTKVSDNDIVSPSSTIVSNTSATQPPPTTSINIVNDYTTSIDNNTTQFHNSAATAISDNTSKLNPTQNTTDKNNKNIFTFAAITANEKPPSREQALVLNSIDGIPQKEYIMAIGKIVSPKNILFGSRISNNSFCIFLSNKIILDNLMETHQTISINEHVIQIRRLINPAKRIVISNVCPSISNQVILDHLKKSNITPIFQLTYLKAGITNEGYEHILNFRRPMFIKHEDAPSIPGSLLINDNDSQYRIFFTDDRITCFNCKAIGHTSLTCKKMAMNKLEITKPLKTVNVTNTLYPSEKISTDQIKFDQPSTSLLTDTIVDESHNDQNDTVFPTLKHQVSLTISPADPTSPTIKILSAPLNQQASKLPKKKINKYSKPPIPPRTSQKTHKTHQWKPTHQIIAPAQIHVDVFPTTLTNTSNQPNNCSKIQNMSTSISHN